MDKEPVNNENEFYRGYAETTQTYLDENARVEFVPKHDSNALKKKAFILILLMAVPMAICFAIIFWSVNFFIAVPFVEILSRFYHVLGGVAGLALSSFIIKNISLADEKKDIVNRHVVLFMGFAAASWIAIECIDAYEEHNSYLMENSYKSIWALIPFAIAAGLMIWSWFIDTKLEKKIFIPIMCVTLLFTGGMIVRDIIRPRMEIESYSVDYYLVSYKEIKPKDQEAKYYIFEELNDDIITHDVYVTFGVLKNCEDMERDIVKYSDQYIDHKIYCDDYAGKILNDIIKDNPIYDEQFFEKNYLIIDLIGYYDTPESIRVSKIFVDGDTMKMQNDFLWEYDKEELPEYMSEFCLAFIKIPKTYDLENVNGFAAHEQFTYQK